MPGTYCLLFARNDVGCKLIGSNGAWSEIGRTIDKLADPRQRRGARHARGGGTARLLRDPAPPRAAPLLSAPDLCKWDACVIYYDFVCDFAFKALAYV